MNFKISIAFLVFISCLLSCDKKEFLESKVMIIPLTSEHIQKKGHFVLSSATQIIDEANFTISSNFLINFLQSGSDIRFKSGSQKTQIVFIKDDSIENPEGYSLSISVDRIDIKSKTDQGAFYAVQSLRQLLPVEFENNTFKNKEVKIACQIIKDEPQFQYRGMHLDVGRHLYSIEFIKKYIDALALLKMNTFHWHLTEDQGWRVEIKQYPKLQEIAAFRSETLKGHYSDQPHQFDGKTYGGYYSQEEIKAIVEYARQRHITIIPEIEMPGHSQAAIAAYPELGCTGEHVEVATKWGVFENIYCSKEETFEFLENVLDEVLELFPSKYIHIGGDEAPKSNWKSCDDCQNRIKTEGLQDEHELQNYFITRIEKYLNSKGREIIGWDEILEGGLAPNATVMSWRGMRGAIEAAKQHHNVIMTPTSHCYFDYYQSEDEGEPLAIGGYLPLEKVYGFNPIPEELSEEESKYVLGAQGNIWTEYMPTSEQVEYMAFPRMLAMSEVVWSKNETKNYKDFVSRVEHFHKRLDVLDFNYANHLYAIEGEIETENSHVFFKLNAASENKTIRFTKDNSEPALTSEVYKAPIPILESTIIKATVFDAQSQLGATFSQEINLHKAVGKIITIDKEPHRSYPGSGAQGLINGISGSDSRYGDKEWLGFWGDDLEITIDLGDEIEVSEIEMRFHNGKGQWIYAPDLVDISFDAQAESRVKVPPSEAIILPIKILVNEKVKTIKLRIPNYGIIPDGKQGAGNKAWTFIDEIIVN